MFDKRLLVWALEDMATRMDIFDEKVVLRTAILHEPGTKFTYGVCMHYKFFIKLLSKYITP